MKGVGCDEVLDGLGVNLKYRVYFELLSYQQLHLCCLTGKKSFMLDTVGVITVCLIL